MTSNIQQFFHKAHRALKDLFAVESKVALAGIDFSSISLSLVQLKKTNNGYSLEHFDRLTPSAGVIANGKVVDAEKLSQAFKKIIETSQCTASGSAIALPGNQALTKEFTLMHKLSDFELQQKVSLKERELFKGASDKFYSDYVQTSSIDANNNLMYKLAVIAVHKNTVKSLLGTAKTASIATKVLDVDHYALARTIKLIAPQLPKKFDDMNIAFVNLGINSFTIVIIHKDAIRFSKRVDFNNPTIERHMQSLLMKNDDASAPEITPEDKELMMSQISKLITAFKDNYRNQNIDQIILSGELAIINNIDKEIHDKFTTEVIRWNPFSNMTIAKEINKEKLKKIAPLLAISCGLAMREVSND